MSGQREADSTRLLGALLTAHFLFACLVKLLQGTPWQLLWFCHLSLALARGRFPDAFQVIQDDRTNERLGFALVVDP